MGFWGVFEGKMREFEKSGVGDRGGGREVGRGGVGVGGRGVGGVGSGEGSDMGGF